MGEEGEGTGAGAEAGNDLGIMGRLCLEGSEDLTPSGAICDNGSQEPLDSLFGECTQRTSEESLAKTNCKKPESIEEGVIDGREEKTTKNSSKDQKKVPRHRRFWESSDCSCSKEVTCYLHRIDLPSNSPMLRSLRRVIGKRVKSHEKGALGNSISGPMLTNSLFSTVFQAG